MRKLKALLQWFVLLDLTEHRHWCDNRECYHHGVCWYCTGIFCGDHERKNCPNCGAEKPKTCNGKLGAPIPCTCGYGRN